MRLLVSAGDPSGDIRAAELLESLSGMARVRCSGLGGDRLAAAGMEVTHHLRDYSVMGFAEVATSLGRLRRLGRALRREALESHPDALLLVDYPGMNLPLAEWAARRGLRVVYYVSPQLWAWGRGRVRRVRRGVDLMMTLFRFEEGFYRERGVPAVWVGHPLVDAVPEPTHSDPDGPLALLPGSRAQEVGGMLPPMLEAVSGLRREGMAPEVTVAVSASVPAELYGAASALPGVRLAGSLREALEGAAAAVVCSGTATLETSLHGVPFVTVYRTSPATWLLARLMVRGVSRIGMANIVTGTDVSPELIQSRVSGPLIAEELRPMLREGAGRDRRLRLLPLVREALGEPGASERAASRLLAEVGGG